MQTQIINNNEVRQFFDYLTTQRNRLMQDWWLRNREIGPLVNNILDLQEDILARPTFYESVPARLKALYELV